MIPIDTFVETSIHKESTIPENTPEIEEFLNDNSVCSSVVKNAASVPAAMDTIGEDEMKEEKEDVVLSLPI